MVTLFRRPLVIVVSLSLALNVILLGLLILGPLIFDPPFSPPGTPGFFREADRRVEKVLRLSVSNSDRRDKALTQARTGLRHIVSEMGKFRELREREMMSMIRNPDTFQNLQTQPLHFRMDELVTSTVRSVVIHLTPEEREKLIQELEKFRPESYRE